MSPNIKDHEGAKANPFRICIDQESTRRKEEIKTAKRVEAGKETETPRKKKKKAFPSLHGPTIVLLVLSSCLLG